METTQIYLTALKILFFMLALYSAIWAYTDAKKKNKPAIIVALFVFFFFWPISLLLWYIFRPIKR